MQQSPTCSLAQPADTAPTLRWMPLIRGSYAAFSKASFNWGMLCGEENLPPFCSAMSPSNCKAEQTVVALLSDACHVCPIEYEAGKTHKGIRPPPPPFSKCKPSDGMEMCGSHQLAASMHTNRTLQMYSHRPGVRCVTASAHLRKHMRSKPAYDQEMNYANKTAVVRTGQSVKVR